MIQSPPAGYEHCPECDRCYDTVNSVEVDGIFVCDECGDDKPIKMYLIEMAWWCWGCAENIGQSFIEKERLRKDDDKCYGCESPSWTELVNKG